MILAETGGDMTVFPTAGHLAYWARRRPGANESAGRGKSTKSRDGNRYLKGALGIAAPGGGPKPSRRTSPPIAGASAHDEVR